MKNTEKLGWVFFLMCSCSGSSENLCRAKGEKIVREIVSILREVENHEELQSATPQLKKQFKKLADVLVETRSLKGEPFQYKDKKEPLQESEALFAEMARLYEIPGCREIIERSQVDAVYVLLKGRQRDFQ
jgi:hypothetical protein